MVKNRSLFAFPMWLWSLYAVVDLRITLTWPLGYDAVVSGKQSLKEPSGTCTLLAVGWSAPESVVHMTERTPISSTRHHTAPDRVGTSVVGTRWWVKALLSLLNLGITKWNSLLELTAFVFGSADTANKSSFFAQR